MHGPICCHTNSFLHPKRTKSRARIFAKCKNAHFEMKEIMNLCGMAIITRSLHKCKRFLY